MSSREGGEHGQYSACGQLHAVSYLVEARKFSAKVPRDGCFRNSPKLPGVVGVLVDSFTATWVYKVNEVGIIDMKLIWRYPNNGA